VDKTKDKAVSRTLSLYQSQWDFLGSQREGKSAYVQALIAKAIAEGDGPHLPNAEAHDCLIRLCELFCPTYKSEMREQCEGIDQPKALARMLSLFAIGESGLSKDFLLAAERFPSPYDTKSRRASRSSGRENDEPIGDKRH